MQHRTISDIREALNNRETSLPEIVHGYLSSIQDTNDHLNALLHYDGEEALRRAREVQRKVENGEAGALAGAVIAVKDLICEKGKPATCGSRILEDFESVYDATAVRRLREEDAILLGRTNMDEFAMGSSNENSAFGPACNPHDPTRVPGGSSGGSAAAVAADFCTAALGSDTGGSVRQPASFCGVVGLKPTYGRISRHGLVAFASSFDCIGPLTRSVEDAARLLEVIAGFDEHDNTSSSRAVPDYLGPLERPNPGIRIGVPEEYFGEGLDEEIREGVRQRLADLEAGGAELVPVSLPHMKYAVAAYYILATAEASSNLARYDGIRYGHRADIKEVQEELKEERAALEEELRRAEGAAAKEKAAARLEEADSSLVRLYKKSRTEGFGEEVKRRILLGTYVLSAGYYDAYYARGQKVRRLIKEDFEKAFEEVDVIASPTAPTTAFPLGEKTDDPLQMYLNDIYTISANLAGICAVSVPAGTHSDGLPYGLQLMAGAFREPELFNAARLVERQG
ncbi:MAG: amidase family protein [Balneolaceae bacterium]|nr:amidase family protein [Balneolaceae bacterium]